MKFKRTEGKPLVAITSTPMRVVADFTKKDVVEVADEDDIAYLKACGYECEGGSKKPSTKPELVAALKELNVEFDESANKADLAKLYAEKTAE